MKKLLALLMALCMLCVMGAACADETPAIDLVATLQAILGEALSLEDYEGFDDADPDYLSVYLIDGEYIELDGVLTVGDTEIVLPMLHGDFVDLGWTSVLPWEDPVKASSMGTGTYTNAAGETISVSIVNNTKEQLPLAKVWIKTISAGEGVNVHTAAFDAKGIHAGSTMADMVEAWGKTYSMTASYYEGAEELEVTVKMTYTAVSDSVTFYVDAETGLVTGVNYSMTPKAN